MRKFRKRVPFSAAAAFGRPSRGLGYCMEFGTAGPGYIKASNIPGLSLRL